MGYYGGSQLFPPHCLDYSADLSYCAEGFLGTDNNRSQEKDPLFTKIQVPLKETFQVADLSHHENLPKRGQHHKVPLMRMEGKYVEENKAQRFLCRKITALWAGKFFHLRVICSGMCKGK